MKVLLDSYHPNSRNIVAITHVCHYWRQVAVNYPLLWSQITVVDQSKVYPELIARSNEVPVSVRLYATGGEISNPQLLEVICANAHRIQELTVEGFGLQRAAREILDQFDRPALNLKAAEFTCYERNIKPLLPSLSRFFDGYAPNLRKLVLDLATIDWDWPVFSHCLTELYVNGPEDSGIPLSVLRRMPNLRVLCSSIPLLDCPTNYDGSVSDPEIVELEFLRKLTLSGSTFRNSWCFFNHLGFPPTTHLNLQMTFDIADAVFPLPRFFSQMHRLQLIFGDCWFRLVGSSTFVDLSIEFLFAPFMNFLETLLTSPTLKFLTLRTDDGHHSSEFSWSTALAQMAHLISLDLDFGRSGRSLLQDLTQSTATIEQRSSPIFLPKLRQLTLKMNESHLSVYDAIDILRDLLCARNNSGVRIPQVSVDATNPALYVRFADPEKIDELRSLVDVLHWDQEVRLM